MLSAEGSLHPDEGTMHYDQGSLLPETAAFLPREGAALPANGRLLVIYQSAHTISGYAQAVDAFTRLARRTYVAQDQAIEGPS